MKHGHFLIMGGFTYFDGEVESVLDFNQFCRLLGSDNRTPEISFPTITAEEIQDKTRGDFLSKAIVVLQSLWFIVHCSARGIQGIALTELEVVTLALASLNGGMYYFWWDKPLGVKEPIKLYRKGKEPAEKIIGDWQERNVSCATFCKYSKPCIITGAHSDFFARQLGSETCPLSFSTLVFLTRSST